MPSYRITLPSGGRKHVEADEYRATATTYQFFRHEGSDKMEIVAEFERSKVLSVEKMG